ncbi:MAG: aspartate ammonia-lyase [bacterium]|nr:aspartate ammonia-lyase [bacterium]
MPAFLARLELFRDLEPAELGRIAVRLVAVEVPAGSLLFEEHAPRRNLHIIESGEVELFQRPPGGGEKRLAWFGPGDFLGEGSFLDDYPHSSCARALVDCRILRLPRDRFLEMIETEPALAARVLARTVRVISRRMTLASVRLANPGAQYVSGRTRSEHDLLGDRAVPHESYYGIQTLRAVENFPISGVALSHHPSLVRALAMVKDACARANAELGHLPQPVADAITRACHEIVQGKLHGHFVVDLIQGGAGTSTNMNANEVIANRALELLGHDKGEYVHCHPNNHVNLSQSTNDAYPTALRVALIHANTGICGVLRELVTAFAAKAAEFTDVLKMGRTQLQDAVPMTLGQEFEAYAVTLGEEIERLEQNAALFLEVNLGGTAIGTGLNADPDFGAKAVAHLRETSGLPVRLAPHLIESTMDTGAFVMYSSALKRLAVKLSKICNDLRLLSSGPRTGLGEINLPPMQPGSSIMPGKVNPVIPEVVNQVAFKVIGNDLTVTMAAEAGQLELNVMEPVIVQSLLESIDMLENGMETLRVRCITGITANVERCLEHVQRSIGVVTALNPVLGYDKSTELAQEALRTGRGVYDLVLEKGLLSREDLDRLLSPAAMVRPRRL